MVLLFGGLGDGVGEFEAVGFVEAGAAPAADFHETQAVLVLGDVEDVDGGEGGRVVVEELLGEGGDLGGVGLGFEGFLVAFAFDAVGGAGDDFAAADDEAELLVDGDGGGDDAEGVRRDGAGIEHVVFPVVEALADDDGAGEFFFAGVGADEDGAVAGEGGVEAVGGFDDLAQGQHDGIALREYLAQWG